MKTTAAWLETYVNTQLPVRELAAVLTNAGTEVEALTPLPDGDTRIEVEVTSNRTDCLGVLGLAREVCAVTGGTLKAPQATLTRQPGSSVPVTIEPDALAKCPHYTAQVIRGVRVGGSPEWLRKRLESVGCASVNNIVDITNFVMFETGQPLHAFDLAKLRGPRIIVRRARASETFDAINHRAYKLSANDLVIADESHPVALAGIMGGAGSEISLATTDVLLESACFEPQGVKATGRRMDAQHSDSLVSDSRHRFERGTDSAGVEAASRRATALIVEIAGGQAVGELSSAGNAQPAWIGTLTLTARGLERTLGSPVPLERCAAALTALGLRVTARDEKHISVDVPSFRRDLTAEIDLIEEIGRVVGLDKFPSRLTLPVAGSRREPDDDAALNLRRLLLSFGFDEVITDSFVPATGAAALTPWPSDAPLEARVPINANWPCLRRSVMPSLVRVHANNVRHGHADARLFERAGVTLTTGADRRELAVLGWIGPDYAAAKGALDGLLERMGLHDTRIEPSTFGLFAPGRGAALMHGVTILGVCGELSDAVMKEYDTPLRAGVAEIDVAALVGLRDRTRMFAALPRFPESQRDLAIVVDETVTWARIEACAAKHGGAKLRSVRFFDEFRGKQIPPGKKSLAFSLTFRDDERTLVSAEVDGAVTSVVSALTAELGAALRA